MNPDMKRRKAYMVKDRKGYSDYCVIAFAETPGKAISHALGTDEFQRCDWDFIELKAKRIPELDSAYRGRLVMDWENMTDRVAMVKEADLYCDPDYITIEDCNNCQAKDWCSGYERMLVEEDF